MCNIKQHAEFAVCKFSTDDLYLHQTPRKIGGATFAVSLFVLHVINVITLGVDQNQGGCREQGKEMANTHTYYKLNDVRAALGLLTSCYY